MRPLSHSSGCVLAFFLISCAASSGKAQVPAFPGAEGAGATSLGGRGGRVIHVTNLDDSGPGSLRAAPEAEGPRTVVFDPAGTISLSKRILVTKGGSRSRAKPPLVAESQFAITR